MSKKPIIITKQGYLLLKSQINKLEKKHKLTATRLDLARLDGDTSENFDFKLLLDKKNELWDKLAYLRKLFNSAKVQDKKSNKLAIELGDTVTWQIIGEQKTITMKITDRIEADPFQGKISVESHLGNRLINKKVGDVVPIEHNGKHKYSVRIIEIK